MAATEKVAVWPVKTLLLAGCAVIEGGAFTVRVAPLLVTLPDVPVTVTVNTAPLSEATVAGVEYAEEVAPLMAVPFFFHWYVRVPVPVAVTLKVAVCPTATVLLAGWEVIEGATPAAVTVSVAALLVTLPKLFVTVTVNFAPLSPLVVAGVV